MSIKSKFQIKKFNFLIFKRYNIIYAQKSLLKNHSWIIKMTLDQGYCNNFVKKSPKFYFQISIAFLNKFIYYVYY